MNPLLNILRFDMKRLIAVISALSGVVSAVLMWICAFEAMKKALFKQIDMTEEEVARLEELGEPTWKSYLPVYFLMLFILLYAISMTVAAVKNGGGAASISSVFVIMTMLFSLFTAKDALGDNPLLINAGLLKCSLLLFVLSVFLLFLFTILSYRRLKRENNRS